MDHETMDLIRGLSFVVVAFGALGLMAWCFAKWKDGYLEEQQRHTERWARLQESGLDLSPDPDGQRTVEIWARPDGTYLIRDRGIDTIGDAVSVQEYRRAHDRGTIGALVLNIGEPPTVQRLEDPDDDQGELEVRTMDGRTLRVPTRPPRDAAPAPVRCKVCKRILTGAVAIEHQLGRTCRKKVKADQAAGATADDSTGATVQRGVAAAAIQEPDTGAAGDILAPPGTPPRGGEQRGARPDDGRGALPGEPEPQPDKGQPDPAADRGDVPVGAGRIPPTAQTLPGDRANGATPASADFPAERERQATEVKAAT